MLKNFVYFSFYLLIIFLVGCGLNTQSLKIKGSDTEVNLVLLLCEKFYEFDKKFSMSISGGGSGLGIASLLNGQADIANSSRPINSYERSLFQQKNIELVEFEFAQDALVIIVNEKNKLDSIDSEDLKLILNGTIEYWNNTENSKNKISVYGRQNNSGTHAYLKKKLNIEFSSHAKEMNGNAQIIEAIKSDPGGIGYVGAGYVIKDGRQSSSGYKILKLAEKKGMIAYSPLDPSAVKEKKYYLQRPLYQYILKSSYTKAKRFLDFEQSKEGNKIILENGYFPIQY